MQRIKDTVQWVVLELQNLLLVSPLRALYLDGPPVLGGWGGATPEDACAGMTGVPAFVWTHNLSPCYDLIEKKVKSWVVTVCVVSYVMTLYSLIKMGCGRLASSLCGEQQLQLKKDY